MHDFLHRADGAVVNINNSETITDANGYYIIYTNLEPGEYMVNGSSNSFCPYNGSLQILDDSSLDNITFNFSLSPIPEAGETRMVLKSSKPRKTKSALHGGASCGDNCLLVCPLPRS